MPSAVRFYPCCRGMPTNLPKTSVPNFFCRASPCISNAKARLLLWCSSISCSQRFNVRHSLLLGYHPVLSNFLLYKPASPEWPERFRQLRTKLKGFKLRRVSALESSVVTSGLQAVRPWPHMC